MFGVTNEEKFGLGLAVFKTRLSVSDSGTRLGTLKSRSHQRGQSHGLHDSVSPGISGLVTLSCLLKIQKIFHRNFSYD